MKAVRASAAFAIAAVLTFWCSEAEAYRPFDGTDAAVVETGEIEVELGPVEYLRAGAERALLKGVLREGTLQEKPGPSIATEFGVLLPGINDQHGTGAVLNGIVSHRWDWGTVHVNAQIELTRQQHADYFLDSIIEGPHDWPVRPVAEFFYESDVSLFRTGSSLVGAIWQVQDNIAVDFGLRGARINGQTAGEIRAGVTFAFGVTKGPDILSALVASALRGFH